MVVVMDVLVCEMLGMKCWGKWGYGGCRDGKVEWVMCMVLGGWVYVVMYGKSDECCCVFIGWLDF